MMNIVRCISCDGYGWHTDEFTGEAADCTWCDGTGYLYEDANGVQQRIPAADYGKIAAQLEQLEQERLHEMGYTGKAKPPWEQSVRKGTRGGVHPNERED